MNQHGHLGAGVDPTHRGDSHLVDVLRDAGRDEDRLVQLDPGGDEPAQPLDPRRTVAANGQVLAQKGSRHRFSSSIARNGDCCGSIGSCFHRRRKPTERPDRDKRPEHNPPERP
jgi:hypothetical protein